MGTGFGVFFEILLLKSLGEIFYVGIVDCEDVIWILGGYFFGFVDRMFL